MNLIIIQKGVWTFFLPFAGLEETKKMIQSMGGKCHGYKVDISNKEEVYRAADTIRREIGDVSTYMLCIIKINDLYKFTIC